MVLLTTTPQILSAISLLPADSPLRNSPLSKNEEDIVLPTTLETPISHKTLISLSHAIRSLPNPSSPTITTTKPTTAAATTPPYTLNTLLQNTRPYYPNPPTPAQPTAEYLTLKSRLLHEKEQREYNALVSNKALTTIATTTSPHLDNDEPDDISPSLILNILLSVVLCSLAVFHASQRLGTDNDSFRSRNREGIRVLLSLGAGIVVGIAETVIYAAYLRKVRAAREREGRRRVVKQIMSTSVIGGENGRFEDGEAKAVKERVEGGSSRVIPFDGEKEEIWGRGVNGGVRRRVREGWAKQCNLEEKHMRNGMM